VISALPNYPHETHILTSSPAYLHLTPSAQSPLLPADDENLNICQLRSIASSADAASGARKMLRWLWVTKANSLSLSALWLQVPAVHAFVDRWTEEPQTLVRLEAYALRLQ